MSHAGAPGAEQYWPKQVLLLGQWSRAVPHANAGEVLLRPRRLRRPRQNGAGRSLAGRCPNIGCPDVDCRLTCISAPCGCRLSGDEAGRLRSLSRAKADAFTGIRRADTASGKRCSTSADSAQEHNGTWYVLRGSCGFRCDHRTVAQVPQGLAGARVFAAVRTQGDERRTRARVSTANGSPERMRGAAAPLVR